MCPVGDDDDNLIQFSASWESSLMPLSLSAHKKLFDWPLPVPRPGARTPHSLSKYRANVARKNGWFSLVKECLEFNDFL